VFYNLDDGEAVSRADEALLDNIQEIEDSRARAEEQRRESVGQQMDLSLVPFTIQLQDMGREAAESSRATLIERMQRQIQDAERRAAFEQTRVEERERILQQELRRFEEERQRHREQLAKLQEENEFRVQTLSNMLESQKGAATREVSGIMFSLQNEIEKRDRQIRNMEIEFTRNERRAAQNIRELEEAMRVANPRLPRFRLFTDETPLPRSSLLTPGPPI
jgi:uncharacterized protein YeeX (DUF496 family)